jgi:nucleotide-binding universal stress UspA family protein
LDGRRLLVAIDGSPAADAAIDAAVDVATAMGASLLFVHADSHLAEQLYDENRDGPSPEEIAARDPVLAAASRHAGDHGVAFDLELIAASTHSADLAADIAGIADGIDAAMIVVGSRGRGTVTGAVLGSLSHALLGETGRPVLIVHAPGTGS